MEFVQKKSDAAPPHWHDSRPPAGQEEFPVVNVTWAEAAAYAAWKGKRLPLETEWERAARGTNGVVFPWGNTWNASAAALQFSPGPVGTREEDVSPAGCRDMAGNVAEWTADAWEKDAAWQVVKGGSWAGPEPERVIRPVFAEPAARTDKDILFVLIDSADRPVLPMLFERNVYITFRGFSGSRERADVVVTKWLPDLPQWVSSHFVVKTGNEIGMPKQVAVRTDEGALRPLLVDFSTGCMLTGFKPEEEPVMLYTDPGGLARQLPREREPKLEAPPMLGPLAEGGATGKGWHALKDIPRGANRLKAPAEGRFANVGFRCAKTPRLLTLIPTAPPDSTRPGHGSSPPPADREARPAK
jgi:hypothetical protein